MSAFKDILRSEFSPFKALSDSELDALEEHYTLLTAWNKKINLTRIESVEQVVRFHYCESMYLGLWLRAEPLTIADVGSGAGFPGLPLAIVRPDCKIDLIESDQRKAVFLREASHYLPNVKVVACRAEDVQTRYDWLVSRAVRRDEILGLDLALNVAMLCSADSGERVPWGDRRRIVTVSRENVSRGTPPVR